MSTTEKLIGGTTKEDYEKAIAALLEAVQPALEWDGEDDVDIYDAANLARSMGRELRADGYQRRRKMTATQVRRQDLRRLCEAIDEYEELAHHEGGALGLNIWEAFESTVKGIRRSAERDDASFWALEDDSNPIATTPVPVPDPTAPPINGIRQGDTLVSTWSSAEERVVLAAPDHRGMVRLSDERDGTADWGGYFASVDQLGTMYKLKGSV